MKLNAERVSKPKQQVGVVIPTYNASCHWPALRTALDRQGLVGEQVLIIDSSSLDNTYALAAQSGYRVVRIPKANFKHGATRRIACDYLPWAELLLFMTQDAVLHSPDSITRLCRALDDELVGAAYGRQIARAEANPIERHGRLFNYPNVSQVRTLEHRQELGFKTAFFSNSFAVYRRSALEAVGGFPKDTIVSEEVTVVARMLMAGWKIAYQADAVAVHSHPLTVRQEFARYFDIAVHHGREKWLLETFGTAGKQGKQFVRSELSFLLHNAPLWIPFSILRTASKYLAYQLGIREQSLPRALSQRLSAHPEFWRV